MLLSIMPSQKEAAYLTLAERLTRKFMILEQDSLLEDLVPVGDNGDRGLKVIERRVLSLKHEHEEDLRLMELIDRAKRGSAPGRALQAETSFWVVSQLVPRESLPIKVRTMALQRLRELATTPGQAVQAIITEIEILLNGQPKQRPKDIQQRVQSLLDEAETSQGYESQWKAPLLRLRAKHRLMQNDFKGAGQDFDAALKACSERNLAGLKGEVAKEGFVTAIANSGTTNFQNHERYYRDMLQYGMITGGEVSFENAATACEEFFWTELYHPYPGFESKRAHSFDVLKAVTTETFGLIHNADWDGLRKVDPKVKTIFRPV